MGLREEMPTGGLLGLGIHTTLQSFQSPSRAAGVPPRRWAVSAWLRTSPRSVAQSFHVADGAMCLGTALAMPRWASSVAMEEALMVTSSVSGKIGWSSRRAAKVALPY